MSRRAGLLPFEIASGAGGDIITDGEAIATLTLASGQTVKQGDRFGPVGGLWYGQICRLGPWEVDAVVSQGSGQAVVRGHLLAARGDHQMFDCGDAAITGAYEVVHPGVDWTVTEMSPGVVKLVRA
jgi:hypothetical protein